MENYGSSVHCEFIFLQVHAADCYNFFPVSSGNVHMYHWSKILDFKKSLNRRDFFSSKATKFIYIIF